MEEQPTKEGFLKHDLYQWDGYNRLPDVVDLATDLMTKEQRDVLVSDFAKDIKIVLRKGTRFVYYETTWFNPELDEPPSDEWVAEHLENIRDIKNV